MENPHETTERSRRRPGWVVPTAVIGLLLVTGIAGWSMQRPMPRDASTEADIDSQPAVTDAASTAEVSPVDPASRIVDGKVGSLDNMLGTWICNDNIRRCIVVREDGTASMNVKLDFIASLLYGSELDMELTWKLDGDTLVYAAVSGEPKANVDRLLKDFGRQQVYEVLEFEDGRMLLELTADKTRYDWRRESP